MKIHRFLKIFGLLMVLGLFGCGSQIHDTELIGFNNGKRNLKQEYKVFKHKYEDGSKGYRLDVQTLFGIGDQLQRKITRTAYLDEAFGLISSHSQSRVNDDVTTTTVKIDGGKIKISSVINAVPTDDLEIDHPGRVYIELHPLLYGRDHDLDEPGSQKFYPILIEGKGEIVDVLVKYAGVKTLINEGTVYETRLFQLQAYTHPEEFDNCYVDRFTLDILKMEIGTMKFIPLKWDR